MNNNNTASFEKIAKHLSELVQLTEDDFAYFEKLATILSFRKKEKVLVAGNKCHYTMYLNSGCMRVYFTDDSGAEHNINFAIEDWWAADLQSFLNEKPATYSIETLEPCEVIALSKTAYDTLIRERPYFGEFFYIRMQRAFNSMQTRLLMYKTMKVEDRYLEFEKKYPEMLRRISQQHIASYLGVTPEFLSAMKKNIFSKR